MNAHVSPVTTTPATTPLLAERAVLARPSISIWTARKFDRTATDEVARNHNASAGKELGRYNKLLIDKKCLQPVEAVANAARTYHYANTLPWADDGARLLPCVSYLEYTAKMTDFRREFSAAVEAFVSQYADAVDEARTRLNGLFRADDYPSSASIRAHFAFDCGIYPVPSGRDFRIDIGDAVRADVERRATEAMTNAMREVAQRITDTVGTMAERLKGYTPGERTGVFRDSLVENVRDLVALLPALNLSGDARLSEVTARMSEKLARYDADDLRQDATLRREVADEASRIVEEVSSFFA